MSRQPWTDRLHPSFFHLLCLFLPRASRDFGPSVRTLEPADSGEPWAWSLCWFLMTKWLLRDPPGPGFIQCLGPLPRSWWPPAQQEAVSSPPTHCPDTSQPPTGPWPFLRHLARGLGTLDPIVMSWPAFCTSWLGPPTPAWILADRQLKWESCHWAAPELKLPSPLSLRWHGVPE